jgi:hypothetical protein
MIGLLRADATSQMNQQFSRHFQHDRVIAAHRLPGERRGQDIVCQLLIRRVVLDSGQALTDDAAHRARTASPLAEAGVIVELGYQVGPAHHDDFGAKQFPDRDGFQVAYLLQRRLDRGAEVKAHHIAQQWYTVWRMRNPGGIDGKPPG